MPSSPQTANDSPAVRGKRSKEALRKLLAANPSLKARRRAEQLLEKLRGPLPPGERLRSLRAVEALEHIGTSEAREVLKTLAKSAPEARLTREANFSAVPSV